MREDIEFKASDGTVLRGWYYRPDRPSAAPHPVIVISHGYGAVKEMALEVFAQQFSGAGLACLVYDHRCFGDSDGQPRQEIAPFVQVSDTHDAITFASGLAGVDPARVGLWGTSYSGGHSLQVAATDSRVRCVVAQVPTISGSRNTVRRFPGDALAEAQRAWAEDRAARANGEQPRMVAVAPELTEADVSSTGDAANLRNDMGAWVKATPAEDLRTWRNETTLRSQELYAAYEPGSYIDRIAPTPLLMICMSQDTITPTDEILHAYRDACEPKRLVLLPGGHCDVYGAQRSAAAEAAAGWFHEHLAGQA